MELINVITSVPEDPDALSEPLISCNTFADMDTQDTSGTIEAEDMFTRIVREYNSEITEDDLKYALSNGYYSYNGQTVTIIWTTPENIQL